jgi:hypothetical protein
MWKKKNKYNILAASYTLRRWPAMFRTRQKIKQEQPPDRRTMCALLSCHPSVVALCPTRLTGREFKRDAKGRPEGDFVIAAMSGRRTL